MLDLHRYLKTSNDYRKIQVDDLLFIEYKCLVNEVKAGIWSEANYFVFVTSGKKMWRSQDHDYVVESGDSLFVKKGANLVHQYFDEDYCALMVFIPDTFIRKFMERFGLGSTGAEDHPQGVSDAVIPVSTDVYLEGYVHSLAAFLSVPSRPDVQLLQLKFEELLLQIFTNPRHQPLATYLLSVNKEQSSQLKQLMEKNFAYNLKVEQYAALCHMSLSSFKRNFQEVYQTSPGKWLSG